MTGTTDVDRSLSRMDDVFKALADPTRAVTQHLGVLEDANLISIAWQGREKLHFVNPVPLYEIQECWIGKFDRRASRPRRSSSGAVVR